MKKYRTIYIESRIKQGLSDQPMKGISDVIMETINSLW